MPLVIKKTVVINRVFLPRHTRIIRFCLKRGEILARLLSTTRRHLEAKEETDKVSYEQVSGPTTRSRAIAQFASHSPRPAKSAETDGGGPASPMPASSSPRLAPDTGP